MESARLFAMLMLVLSLGVLSASVRAGEGGKPADKLKVIYFGNSLTANSMPDFHPALGRSAGKEWDATLIAGAGWQVNFHRFALLGAGLDFGDRGDLTIDRDAAGQAKQDVKRFTEEKYDAMLLQPFSAPLKNMKMEHMGIRFNQPTDVGELLPITPENVAIVNDAIWDVVSGQPDATGPQ